MCEVASPTRSDSEASAVQMLDVVALQNQGEPP